jgi:hypothetical protein
MNHGILFTQDSRQYTHEREKHFHEHQATDLSLSLTLHDTNSPSHNIAWQQKSSCPQKK